MLSVASSNILALVTAVAIGGEIKNMQVIGDDTNPDFVVPSGKVFVLTDIFVSPQSFPPPNGFYRVQILPSVEVFTTAITLISQSNNPASFQTHLTTGMVFQSGSTVRVALTDGVSSVDVNCFGFLDVAS
jgi:hypothetical protein